MWTYIFQHCVVFHDINFALSFVHAIIYCSLFLVFISEEKKTILIIYILTMIIFFYHFCITHLFLLSFIQCILSVRKQV